MITQIKRFDVSEIEAVNQFLVEKVDYLVSSEKTSPVMIRDNGIFVLYYSDQDEPVSADDYKKMHLDSLKKEREKIFATLIGAKIDYDSAVLRIDAGQEANTKKVVDDAQKSKILSFDTLENKKAELKAYDKLISGLETGVITFDEYFNVESEDK